RTGLLAPAPVLRAAVGRCLRAADTLSAELGAGAPTRGAVRGAARIPSARLALSALRASGTTEAGSARVRSAKQGRAGGCGQACRSSLLGAADSQPRRHRSLFIPDALRVCPTSIGRKKVSHKPEAPARRSPRRRFGLVGGTCRPGYQE